MWLSEVNAQEDASRCSLQRITRSPRCLKQKLGRVHKKDQANPNESQRRFQERNSRGDPSRWSDTSNPLATEATANKVTKLA